MREIVKKLLAFSVLMLVLLIPLGGCGPKATNIDEHLQKTESAVAAAQKMGLKGWLIVDAPLEAGVRTQTTFGNGGRVFGLFMIDPEAVANTFPSAAEAEETIDPAEEAEPDLAAVSEPVNSE